VEEGNGAKLFTVFHGLVIEREQEKATTGGSLKITVSGEKPRQRRSRGSPFPIKGGRKSLKIHGRKTLHYDERRSAQGGDLRRCAKTTLKEKRVGGLVLRNC